ncbi:hypothetical protein BO78DRAFT_450889 [Aspergillus sclerotiicarbonarius CBS 121057]|uniref:Alpha/beta hydrolase fold-3 domain-containing protein n=1 Tax=Aspergillus sclerotiicarbonarius (strain CBS 121057 / IBT 28362) TaxID=1448318 RepID=A0A319ESM4_ASPSB|nr:hypothetical protein BO78DRAFT_450889 [Aspergillus sclerotiicarbonarius CBS 121057]
MSTPAEQRELVKRTCQKYRASPWTPITQIQRETSRDPRARGGVWIGRTVFPGPAKDGPILDVGVEFIGSKPKGKKDAPELDLTEEKLRVLLKEYDSEMTILYIHGGGLYFGSPAQSRAASARLAKMTKAPVASIKYRLAPSHTFPAPILDTLVAYAGLLYPPPGAPYRTVPADKIILAGNSSNLCFGLTNYDQCDALPSWHKNGGYDIIGVLQPPLMAGFPTDGIWPANSPREHAYCVAATLDHELRGQGFAESDLGRSVAVRWLMPDCRKEDLGSPENLAPLPCAEVRRRMREYNATRPVWTERLGVARL